MDRLPYTCARWLVRPGQEEAFVAAWHELAEEFLRLPHPPQWGMLVRNVDNPREFVSFGPWPDMDAIAAMRASAKATASLGRVRALCEESTPGNYAVAATAGALPDIL